MTRTEIHRLLDVARGKGPHDLRLLEGPKAVRDALEGEGVLELWLREDLEGDLAARARERGVSVAFGTARDFERLGRTVTPQGALAVIRDPVCDLAEVAALAGPLLWLDAVQDPGNVGALVRSAAAFGAAGVLVGAGSADPVGPKALRASAGLSLRVPFARATDDAIAAAVASRPVWGLDAGGEDLFEIFDVPGTLVLVVGSEGRGFGAVARRAMSREIGIPIDPAVESLNVAVAGGIALALLRGRRA